MTAMDNALKALAEAQRRQLPLEAQQKLARKIRDAFGAMPPAALANELGRLADKSGWVELLGLAHGTLIAAAQSGLLSRHPDHSAAIARARSALDGARAKAATMGDARVTAVQRWASQTKTHRLEISVWTPHRPAGMNLMCWDHVDLDGIDPVLAHLALAGAVDRLEFRLGERPPLDTPGPLDRYHPERFRSVHRYLDHLGPAAAEIGQPTSQTGWEAAYQVLAGRAVEAYNRRIGELPRAVFDREPPTGSIPLNQAVSLAAHTLTFRAHGKQIFDLPPSLVERFRQTDVDDVPMAMLHLPYPAFYLYWGPQPDLELEPGWLIDGAYVSGHLPELLQVVVTCAPTDSTRVSWWPVYPEPYYFQAFRKEQLGKDVGTAVDEVLAETLKELRHKAQQGLGPAFTEAVQTLQEEVGADAHLPQMTDVGRITGAAALDAQQRRHGTYLQALRLVINGLCYLTAYPDDSAAAYPAAAPHELVKATASTDFRTAKRARDRLAELGYLPVHLCGQELQAAPAAGHGDHHVRAHWRRGHWRRQPYGEGRQLRKLIWVMPMIVGGNAGGDDEPLGHLYLVS